MRGALLFMMIAVVVIASLAVGAWRFDNAEEFAALGQAASINDDVQLSSTTTKASSTNANVSTNNAAASSSTNATSANTNAAAQTSSTQTSSSTTSSPTTISSALRNIPHIGSVQVLNGCGVEGAANRMADFLRSRNFDVKDIGNAPSWNYPATMIVSRSADLTLANEIERVLKTGRVIIMRNGDQLYDVAVITGPDLNQRITSQ